MIGDRCLRVAHHAFILVLVVATAAVLSAQTVVDPRYVEFTPSADHNTNASDGTPLVQRYSLSVYVVGSSVAFDTMDLGKPTPSGGVIRVDFLPLLHGVPTPGVVFEARVTSVGPGGSAASSLSNGFSFQPACAPSINPTSQSVVSGGGTGSVGVTAGAGCNWSATSNAGWITLTGATGGTGNGSVPFGVSANTGSARTGTLTVAGRTYTVNQAALSCSYTVSPTSQAMPVGGGPGLTDVTAPAGCTWTAVSNNTGWLTVTSSASGNGNGTVGFSTTANPNGTTRSGTITIAGRTFSVTQAAVPCSYSLTATSQSMASTGGTGSTGVTAPTGCAWTGVSNNTGWLTVTSGASGSGNGTVGFSASANASSVSRTGTLTVGGQTFSVTQAGAPCTYSISPPSQSIAAGSATGSTGVTAPTGCTWTGVSNNTGWLTVTSGASGSGNGSVGFSATANTSTSQRSGTLTVAGETFTVTQAAAGCTFAISSNSLSSPATGGTGSTDVISGAGCPWSAESNDNWITVTSGAAGSGDGSVGFSVAANTTTSARTGTLTIATRTFTVSQAAAACSYSLTSSSQSVAAAGGAGSTAVNAPSGCAWTGVSNDTGWLTVTSGANGSGNGSVGFSASANASSSPRSGTLTVAGQTFTVTQSGAGCTFAISSTSLSAPAAGGTASTNVTAGTGCPWSAASNNTWLSVTSGANGSGNGTVSLRATANPNTWGRSGTLTIATHTFTVSQAGSACTYSLNPTSRNIGSTAASTTTGVTTGAGCVWTAVSNATGWLRISGNATGTGSGTVSLTATANTTAQARVGTVAISGQTFTVTQAAANCSYALTPANRTIGGDGGTGTITVGTGCSWTATTTQSWISVSGTGTGAGSVSYTVSRNTSATQRTGSISIGTQTFTITQSASTNMPAAPSGLRIAVTGGSD